MSSRRVEPAASLVGDIAVPGVKGLCQRAALLAAVADGVIAAAVTDEIPTVPAQTTASDRPASDGPQNTDLAENAPKPELKILPPETPRRVEQSWESKSFGDVAGQPGAGLAAQQAFRRGALE